MNQAVQADRWRNAGSEMQALGRLFGGQFMLPTTWRRVGKGRPVMVLPGYLFGDFSTGLLRRSLKASGFRSFSWEQGVNLNKAEALPRLMDRLDQIHRRTGQRVALVGWSLGGIYARELARLRPDQVSAVVTLGTPHSQGEHVSRGWRAELGNSLDRGSGLAGRSATFRRGGNPAVPTYAVWSPNDTIVPPASASGSRFGVEHDVRVNCRHTDFVTDPGALRAVIDVLADAA